MPNKTSILFCECRHYDIFPENIKADILTALKEADIEFEKVDDLCGLSARRDPILHRWAKTDTLKVAACYRRTIKWLFYAAGVPLEDSAVEVFNMRTDNAQKVISSLLDRDPATGSQTDVKPAIADEWVPWFPVIDYDRCENCKQCLNFCLFGVYELSADQQVRVAKPENCKTNCPACARMCPQSAIIFPKYTDDPINGAEVDQTQVDGKAKIDVTAILEGNIHQALRRRSTGKKRFSSHKNKEPRNLTELQKQLKIPTEALETMSASELTNLKSKMEKKASD